MNPLTTNFPLTNITNPLTSKLSANVTAANASSSSGSATDASNIGSTFLSLLTQELQNQDPTAPMDSTAMVGQMISLNQLSQLVSMNQTLSNLSGTSSTSSSAVAGALNNNAATAASMQNAAGSASTLAMMFPSSQLSSLQTSGVGKTGL